MKAPFTYFGGKAKVANLVWGALGQPRHYIEPFFGSGAVLLNRLGYNPIDYTETVNDADGILCNVWRGLQFAPDEVAKWCDWPVNHADLSARRKVILREKAGLTDRLIADDNYFDAKLAGYWVWAASCWIGSGLTRPNAIPHISDGGKGVQDPYNTNIYRWFRQLSERLRYVRVVCGDWTRVCGGNWQDNMGNVGIFFDPPYAVSDRDDVYDTDDFDVANKVRKWAIERGKLPSYKIVIAGYDEHKEELANAGWSMVHWKANGGYGNLGDKSFRGKKNRFREILYFSPACNKSELSLL